MIETDKLIDKIQESFNKRNYDYAIDLSKQILELNPENHIARKILRSSLVGKYELQGTRPSAILAVLIGFIPIIKINIFSILKKYDKVLQAGEEFLSNNPFSIWGRLVVARSLRQLNYIDSAIDEFELLNNLKPSNIKILKSLGNLYYLKSDIKKSTQYYQMALSLQPSDLEISRALKDLSALNTLNEGGWSDAKSSRDIVKDTSNSQGLERESQMVKDGEIPQEIERLSNVIKNDANNPENVRYLKKIGELYIRQKNLLFALKVYEQAFKLAPSDGSIYMKIGDIKLLFFDEKIKEVQQKLKIEHDSQSLKDALMKIKEEKKKFQIDEYQQRVKLHPTNLLFKYQLGCAFYDANLFDEAIAEFQSSLRNYKLKTDSLNHLGLCFIAKKHCDMAINQFTMALENTSLTTDATKKIRYNLALAYEYNKNYEQALAEYKRILEVDINYRDANERVNNLQKTINTK
jgi:tetratricopeptide (TPR) repeat protein